MGVADTPRSRVKSLALGSARAAKINGAYLMQEEHETGSLEVGKAADLVVLER